MVAEAGFLSLSQWSFTPRNLKSNVLSINSFNDALKTFYLMFKTKIVVNLLPCHVILIKNTIKILRDGGGGICYIPLPVDHPYTDLKPVAKGNTASNRSQVHWLEQAFIASTIHHGNKGKELFLSHIQVLSPVEHQEVSQYVGNEPVLSPVPVKPRFVWV